ncbi:MULTISPECIES: hypothetical protein [Halorussus]|uniref:hypothetical protein n=1 Tax=Halorussus TaxID=1070314 RepID=UPI000E21A32B|nr:MULTISPECIES: hypothetical protein [Halorussus]NHN61555.1 hypothetical protein [Halorussus sp. JP-T4]
MPGASRDPDATPAALARERVLDSHRETVGTVLRCADAVADSWDGGSTADPAALADPLRAGLDAAGAWRRLPEALADAVDATGESLSAHPVAAPPYVVATSRGPMLRATLSEGRLVVLLRAFEIERAPNEPPRYRRGPQSPADAVRATFK